MSADLGPRDPAGYAAGGDAGVAGGAMPPPDANEIAMQKEAVLRQILDPAARLRLNNVRMVRPEVAASLENQLITLAAQGRLAAQITDDQLKQMLMSMRQPKRDFKFSRR